MSYYTDDSPQQKAAKVSGRNRRRRVDERRELKERESVQRTPGHHPTCECDSCGEMPVAVLLREAAESLRVHESDDRRWLAVAGWLDSWAVAGAGVPQHQAALAVARAVLNGAA